MTNYAVLVVFRQALCPYILIYGREDLRKHERTGRPLGREGFVKKLEGTLGRILRKRKPGRKKEDDHN